jgi:2-succinyl-6-hydroxy-2,4-cyclohexadiene-1-carboxylate synthase
MCMRHNLLGTGCDYELTPPKPGVPVLVFVHGWLLSRAYWQPLVDILSQQYQCLTYDLRGFGRSHPGLPWQQSVRRTADSSDAVAGVNTGGVNTGGVNAGTANPYSLQSYAQDLVTLLGDLNIRQAWLVGHSLGGSIALWTADLAPDVVVGVVGVNAGGGIYLQAEFERFRNAGQQLVKFRPHWLRYMPLMDWAFGRMAVTQPLDRRWGRQRLMDFLAADGAAAQQSLLASTTPAQVHQLPQLVAALKQPIYFIAGCQDRLMEPKYVQHLASFHGLFQAAGANVIALDNCGHLAMLEQTAQVAQQIQLILHQGQSAITAPIAG